MAKLICKTCGQEYEACPNCPRTDKFTPWRKLCCSASHFQLFVLVSDWNSKTINKEEALERLQRHKLSKEDIDALLPDCRKALYEIMGWDYTEKIQVSEDQPLDEVVSKTNKIQTKLNDINTVSKITNKEDEPKKISKLQKVLRKLKK